MAAGAALVVFVAACSSAASPVLSTVGNAISDGRAAASAAPSAAPAMPAPAEQPGTGLEGGVDQTAGGTTGSTGVPSGEAAAFQADAAIVKTGTLSVEVADLDVALVKARSVVVGSGGYVSGSQESRSSDHPIASVTYRIPAGGWDDTLDKLRGLGKPLEENTSAVEVTGQLVDLQARISNLRSTESALQAIMVKASKISDILDVQNQLTSVQGQIEELAGQQAHLQDQASYGTLTVTWTIPAPPAVAVTSKGWDPGKEIDAAVASLLDGLQALATIGIWLGIVGLPLLIGLAVLVGIAVFMLRRLGLGRTTPAFPGPAAPGTPTAV